MLGQVGRSERLSHRPHQLSGGERQRAAVARALIHDPAVLLCDEPSGNLDARNAKALHALLAGLNRERGTSVLIVTHDEALARGAARPLTLREGRLSPAGLAGSAVAPTAPD